MKLKRGQMIDAGWTVFGIRIAAAHVGENISAEELRDVTAMDLALYLLLVAEDLDTYEAES